MAEDREDVRLDKNGPEDANAETLNVTGVQAVHADADVDTDKSTASNSNDSDKSEIMDFLSDLFGMVGEGGKAVRAREASTDIKLDIAIRELNEEIARKREERRRQ